jgi:hypothetical protein
MTSSGVCRSSVPAISSWRASLPSPPNPTASSLPPSGIELDGQTIALTPENAPRIRRAILDLRADLRRARDNARDPGISQLQTRFDNWFDQLEMLKPNPLDTSTRAAVQGLIAYCRNKLSRLAVKYGC